MIKISAKSFRKYLAVALSVFLSGCDNGTKPYIDSNPGPITAKTTEVFVPADNSVDMAKAMKIGWNLGNTFDAWSDNAKGLSSETCWSQPKTTRAMFQGLKQAGFVSVRIPVSWHDHITDATNYNIDTAWMNRVKEVVDWALDEGLCVIINIHHDNFSDKDLQNRTYGFAVSNDTELQEKSTKYIAGVWKNVAEAFKDYDHNLVFELLNEPRDIDGANWGNEWNISKTGEMEANEIIGKYEKAALDVIRATGSKNANRFIMVPPYAASTGHMDNFSIPEDSATNRIIIEAHAYSPYNFAMASPGDVAFTSAHKNELSWMFNNLYNNYVSKGIGVVIDETGATNKNNLADRIEWAKYFFGEAYKKGIPSFWWDNGSWQVQGNDYNEKYGYYNRTKQVWYFPELMKASLEAVGISLEATETETGTSDDAGAQNLPDYTAEDLVIFENKTVITTNTWDNFSLGSPVDLTNYKYLKTEIYCPNAENADSRQLVVQYFNSGWKKISEAKTINVSANIYTDISEPEAGSRDLMFIQPVVINAEGKPMPGYNLNLKKVTATNTKN